MDVTTYWLNMKKAVSGSRNNAENKDFRRDINGLRALAVAAVVLYHFNIGGLTGGFVGVDIFFVISGFLMSGIITHGLQQGHFSFGKFYWARAQRILPALIVVSMVLLVVGWFYLSPNDYKMLGRHVRQSLVFLSNFSYLKESGYFDTASHGKWLLHTWSLSVEWQFYLALPVLLALVWRFFPSKKGLMVFHVVALICSLATCIALTHSAPQKAFYLIQSRAWEMLLGGLCFLLFAELKYAMIIRRVLEIGGLILVAGSIFFLQSSNAWPGYQAILPTLGTAMVLAAKRENTLWANNHIAEWLGTRSYSLYLWHWPLVAALFYFYQQDNSVWITAAILLTLVLGELSYRFVEQPTRRFLKLSRGPVAISCLIASVLVTGGLAAYVVSKNGLSVRLPSAIIQMEEQAQIGISKRTAKCLEEGLPCVYGGQEVKVVITGDSHAATLIDVAQSALPNPDQGIYFHAAPACLPVPGLTLREHANDDKDDPCNRIKLELAKTTDAEMGRLPIIEINRTPMYPLGYNGADQTEKRRPQAYATKPLDKPTPESLKEFGKLYVDNACAIAKTRTLYLMRPLPEMRVEVPDAVGKRMLMGNTQDFALSREDYKARNAFVWSIQDQAHEQCGVKILDPLPYLCDESLCYGSRNGKPLYLDDNHLNVLGSELLAPMFKKVFEAIPGITEHSASR